VGREREAGAKVGSGLAEPGATRAARGKRRSGRQRSSGQGSKRKDWAKGWRGSHPRSGAVASRSGLLGHGSVPSTSRGRFASARPAASGRRQLAESPQCRASPPLAFVATSVRPSPALIDRRGLLQATPASLRPTLAVPSALAERIPWARPAGPPGPTLGGVRGVPDPGGEAEGDAAGWVGRRPGRTAPGCPSRKCGGETRSQTAGLAPPVTASVVGKCVTGCAGLLCLAYDS
jgi:hypothetical protein